MALIIVATIYENKLIQKGYDFGEKKMKGEKEAERHEMNHFSNNNNNENECEMYTKIHQESDSEKLGKRHRKKSFPFH